MSRYVDGQWVEGHIEEKAAGGWASETGFRFRSVSVIKPILEPGLYKFERTDQGKFFVKHSLSSDDAIALPGLPIDYILNQIKKFWDKEETYKKYGLIHKRGVLLYGPPGCGKTSIIKLMIDEIIKIKGIVFCIDDFQDAADFIKEFRRVEPTRPILTIQEDIEGIFSGDSGDDQAKAALSFLDGQDQVNNIVHVATSNEPEKIADRFIKRPGRFDLVIGIRPPRAETRRAYFQHVCKTEIPKEKLDELVEKTEGLGLSYLRELASTFLCLEIPLEETIERLQKNAKTRVFKNAAEKGLGFELGYSEEEKDA